MASSIPPRASSHSELDELEKLTNELAAISLSSADPTQAIFRGRSVIVPSIGSNIASSIAARATSDPKSRNHSPILSRPGSPDTTTVFTKPRRSHLRNESVGSATALSTYLSRNSSSGKLMGSEPDAVELITIPIHLHVLKEKLSASIELLNHDTSQIRSISSSSSCPPISTQQLESLHQSLPIIIDTARVEGALQIKVYGALTKDDIPKLTSLITPFQKKSTSKLVIHLEYTESALQQMNSDCFSYINEHLIPHVTVFRCSNFTSHSDIIVERLTLLCANLQKLLCLKFDNCSGIDSNHLATFICSCRTLNELSVTDHPTFDDENLKTITERLPHLTKCDVHGCVKITSTAIIQLLQTSTAIQELDIGQTQVSNTFFSVDNQALKSTALTHLILSYLAIDSFPLEQLEKGVPNLQVLDLQGCSKITASSIQRIMRYHNLKGLNIKQCSAISKDDLMLLRARAGRQCQIDHDFLNLPELPADEEALLNHLEDYLNAIFSKCKVTSNNDCIEIKLIVDTLDIQPIPLNFPICFESLKTYLSKKKVHLTTSWNSFLRKTALTTFINEIDPFLTSLTIVSIGTHSKIALQHDYIFQHVTKLYLQKLSVTSSQLQHIHCSKLSSLEIEDCQNLGNDFFESIPRKFPQLETLELKGNSDLQLENLLFCASQLKLLKTCSFSAFDVHRLHLYTLDKKIQLLAQLNKNLPFANSKVIEDELLKSITIEAKTVTNLFLRATTHDSPQLQNACCAFLNNLWKEFIHFKIDGKQFTIHFFDSFIAHFDKYCSTLKKILTPIAIALEVEVVLSGQCARTPDPQTLYDLSEFLREISGSIKKFRFLPPASMSYLCGLERYIDAQTTTCYVELKGCIFSNQKTPEGKKIPGITTLSELLSKSKLLSHLKLEECSAITIEDLETLVQNTPTLSKIEFSNIPDLSDAHIEALRPLFPHLTLLSIQNCPLCTENILLTLSGNTNNLTTLALTGSAIRDKKFEKITLSFPQLQTLDLSNTSSSLYYILQALHKGSTNAIKQLLLFQTNTSSDAIADIKERFPKITTLDLRDTLVTIEDIQKLCTSWTPGTPPIQLNIGKPGWSAYKNKIIFDFDQQFDLNMIALLLSNFQAANSLHLQNFENANNEYLHLLILSLGKRQIQNAFITSLHITSNHFEATEELIAIINILKNLEKITLTGTIDINTTGQLLEACSSVSTLKLRHVSEACVIKQDHLLALAPALSSIKTLELEGFTELTEQGKQQLQANIASLETLTCRLSK